jgi:hypothetical protein
MNKDIFYSFLEQAGFMLWMDEPWGPPEGGVDWSCNYDREIEQFAMLIVAKCVQICNEGVSTQMTSSGAASRIEDYFMNGNSMESNNETV